MTPDFCNELLKVLQGINEDLSTLVDQMPSRRDLLAGMAMQGFITGCYVGNNAGFTVQGNVFAALEYADALIAALDRKSELKIPIARNESELP